MLLVFNPKSGRGEFVRRLYEVVDVFSTAGYEVVVYPTAAGGDACARILARGGGFDLVVCSGGDGMVNEAVNAYMRLANPPPLAFIPSGTINDYATSLELPRDAVEAAQTIVDGKVRTVDAGAFGDNYFSYVAAFGWFTNIPYTTDQNVKNIIGRAAYFFEGIKYLASMPSIECSFDVDGEVISGRYTIGIVANSTSIGGFKSFVDRDAAIDDGLFEMIFVKSPQNIIESQEIIGTLGGLQESSELVVQRTAKRVAVSSGQPCDWTIDGEYGGYHQNIVIENLHRALSIVVPKYLQWL